MELSRCTGSRVSKHERRRENNGYQLVLENLHNFNTIYLDNDFDRSQIDFMIGNFKNGDEKTKQYLLDKQYNLND